MRRILTAVIMLSASFNLFAGYSGMPLEFMNAGMGARYAALGNAASAASYDAAAMYYNPALLDNAVENRIQLGVKTLFEGAHYETLAYVNPIGKAGAFGLNLGIVNYGEYENVNEGGVVTGKTQVNDMFLGMGFGRQLFYGIKGGITFKAALRSLSGKQYTGFNMDAGLQKKFGSIDMGLAVINPLPLEIKYETSSEKFVTSLRAGIAYTFDQPFAVVSLDAEKRFINSPPSINAGIEYKPIQGIYLRAGVSEALEKNAITGGFGYENSGFALDYALEYGTSLFHSIGISYGFNSYLTSVTAEPKIFSPIGGVKKTYLRTKVRQKYDIYKWELTVKNSKGEIMKKWEGPQMPDDSYVWDGLADDGMPCAEGEYTAQLTVIDENDSVFRSEIFVIKISNTGENLMPMGIE